MDLKFLLLNGRSLNYTHYLDERRLSDPEQVAREMEAVLRLFAERLAKRLSALDPDALRQTVVMNDRIFVEIRSDLEETLEHAMSQETPNEFEVLVKALLLRRFTRPYTYDGLMIEAGISPQLFHTMMRKGGQGETRRQNIMKLAFVLHASPEEAEQLLNAKGFTFRYTVKSDIIVRHCLEHRIFEPREVDDLLVEHGCTALFA
jgi:hypothetical protein